MHISELLARAYQAAVLKGFYDNDVTPNKGEKFMLMVTELAEAFEGIRNGNPPDQHCPNFTSEEIELADAMIRIADYAGRFHLRLEQAIEAKLAFNETRPYKHGKTC